MNPSACDIVGIGVIAVDDMLFVESYTPGENFKTRVSERRRQGGGTMSCALAAAAKLGSSCKALGRLGENELSRFVYDSLGGTGVDLSVIQKSKEAEPVYCVIVVSKKTGSRAIYGDYSRTNPLGPDELRPEWFAEAKVLLVDHFSPPTMLAAVKMAKSMGLQVVSDIERESSELRDIRTYIDHFVCSAEFAVPFSGCATPQAACEALEKDGKHSTVVVTAGEHGCYYCSREHAGVRHVPAHRVTAADTTGCGDVFHGVFCHGIAQGWAIEEVIRHANAAAAIKATRTGGWLAVPDATEIATLLNQKE